MGGWTDIFATKYRTREQKVPDYFAHDIDYIDKNKYAQLFNNDDYAVYADKAERIAWIASNIIRQSREINSSKIYLEDRKSRERIDSHEILDLIELPNEFFSFEAILEYVVWDLNLSRRGGFIWMAPSNRNQNKIMELWPLLADNIRPIKDENQFISGYWYYTEGDDKPLWLNPKYVIRFFFPDRDDYWANLTPLKYLVPAIDIYEALTESQESLFSEGGGVPLSVVMVDENTSTPDFEEIRDRLRVDWQNKKRIAIARGGTFDVKTVGVSNRELEAISSQKLNRDEIDSAFMLIPWRSSEYTSGEGLKEANKQIKENVIYPMQKMLAAQMQLHMVNKFWVEDNVRIKFEDVRKLDKSLQISEWNVTWRAKTLNGARTDLGDLPFTHPVLTDLGDLPLALATNPSFVLSYYGIAQQQTSDSANTTNEPGNIDEMLSPERQVNYNINDAKSLTNAEKLGIITELKNYQTVVKRVMQRKGKNANEVEFETDIVPESILQEIKSNLVGELSTDEITNIFNAMIDKVKNG